MPRVKQKKFKPWSADETQRMYEMIESRATVREIAKRLNRTENAVKSKLRRCQLRVLAQRSQSAVIGGGGTKGGMLVVRLSPKLHRDFAWFCRKTRVSMNSRVVEHIRRDVAN